MKKTLVSLTAAIIMCMTMTILTFADSITSDDLWEKLEEESRAQQPACDVYERLMEQIESEDENGFIYPDEYGGSYINEDHQLVIGLTDLTEESIAEYEGYCKGNTELLEFVQVDYSYNELQECANAISEQGMDHVVEVGVAEDKNNVSVGVDVSHSDAIAKIKNRIQPMTRMKKVKADIPVEVEWVGGAKTSTTDVIGGVSLSSGATLGVCGTYNGSSAFLTSGHGHTLNKTIKRSGTTIGTVVKTQFANNKNYDYGIVKITNSSFKITNKVYGSTKLQTMTSTASKVPAVGTVVSYYGAKSGYGQYKITKRSSSISYDNGVTIKKLVICDPKASKRAALGDSGAPVYKGHVFQGVLSGIGDKGEKMFYSPITGVTSDFKMKTS